MKKICMMIAVLIVFMFSISAVSEQPESAVIGQLAPDFEVELISGETFKLSDCQGKVVFLNIWATWCPPCVAEMPDIQALSEAHPDDLVVIGISCDNTLDEVLSFVQEHGYTYNIAWDSTRIIGGLLYPSYYIPNSIFIDPDGIITQMGFGGASYEIMEQNYLDALNHVVNEQP